ncbi:hypothetical protein [Tardiphaga sp. P9-11]|uniref:hypothetical protein n=1 Tax=Tardiphaga sp. P9-11 TaxID=2024614 RepID=UPI0011F3F1E3|nr:hypothetical protein [Tardiphaga sp. P9-11]KAA0070014.1 hypothetical protein CIW50_28030 [Tardiphaga sp. P9-11]
MAQAEKVDVQGKIIRRDPDGFGLVEISKPVTEVIAVFTSEVLQNPAIAQSCVKGTEITGRAVVKDGGYKMIRLEPSNWTHK